MRSLRHNIAMRTVKLLDAVLLTIPFGACWYLAYAENLAEPYYRKGNWLVIALFFVIYVTYGRIYDGFRVSISRVSEMFISQTLALLITDGILLVVTWLLTKHFPPVWPLVLTLAVQVLLSMVWCIGAHQWYFHRYDPQKTAVVYDTREGLDTLIAEYGLDKRFQVVATADVATALNDQLQILDGIEAIFLFGTHSHERNIILKQCVARDIEVYLIPRIGDVIMSGAERIHMFHLPMLRVGRYDPNPEYLFIKRAFDLLVSGLALVVLCPIMLLVAAAVKLTDGGPAFYRQCRLTKDGKTFDVLKFRSMRVDAEKDGVARLSTGENDDRITPIGRFIRKCRLDELPQLINIFRGEMSLVGPRPERPEIAAQYEEELPEFALRLQAKAGLTGYAQVYGKYNTTPYDKLQMDLMYIANPSFVEDLKILFATIRILFVSESTEGVAQGQTTATKKKADTTAAYPDYDYATDSLVGDPYY